MLDFIKSIVRTKVTDLEAKLLPTEACTYGGQAEVEFEMFSDGQGKIEFEIEHADIPVGSIVFVFVGGKHVGEVVTSPGKVKEVVWLNDTILAVPNIEVGEVAEMEIDGEVCYRGQFYRD